MSRPRVLRRPLGGWGARAWRREVALWAAWAAVVVGSWASLNVATALIDLVAR